MKLENLKKVELIEIIELNDMMHEAELDNARFEYKALLTNSNKNLEILWELGDRLLTVARTCYIITTGLKDADKPVTRKQLIGRIDFIKSMSYRVLDAHSMTKHCEARSAARKAEIEAQVQEQALIKTEVIS